MMHFVISIKIESKDGKCPGFKEDNIDVWVTYRNSTYVATGVATGVRNEYVGVAQQPRAAALDYVQQIVGET